MENLKNTPIINKSEFIKDATDGMHKEALVEKYGVSKGTVTEICKRLNITLRRYVAPKYILVDDNGNRLEDLNEKQETELSLEENNETPESLNGEGNTNMYGNI